MSTCRGVARSSRNPAAANIGRTRPGSRSAIGPGASGSPGGSAPSRASATRLGSANHGFEATPCHTANAARPPGRRAAWMLRKAATVSSKNMTPKRDTARSNRPGGKSCTCASPSSNLACPPPPAGSALAPALTAARARAISRADMSRPSTCPPGPTACASARVDAPAPQPMSSTTSPGCGSAASSRRWPACAPTWSRSDWKSTQTCPPPPFQNSA